MPVSVSASAPWNARHKKYQQPLKNNNNNNNNNNQSSKSSKNNTRTTLKTLIQQPTDLLQIAQNEGFLHALTEDELTENSQDAKNKKPSYPGNASLLSLASRRLQDISLLDLCERLEICILSNNFIDNIEALKWCRNLLCLDVHSNQLSHIPGKKFWASLPNLSMVFMHNNGFAHLEEVKYISHSPSLCTLTLYDSPISLKKNYRHCVVNAVWTLKALDNYVISDEEIIEDAHFTDVFKPLRKQFCYRSNFCTNNQKIKKQLTYDDAKYLIKEEMHRINSIQSRYSPVLILQKCIRGFLVRLKYNYIKDTRLWAAVSIQRFYRDRKGYPNPPPTSPTPQYVEHMYQSLSSIRLDYETYLRLRRSRHRSNLSVKSLPYRLPPAESADDRIYNLSINSKPIYRHISVNLEKLDNQTTDILNKASDSNPLRGPTNLFTFGGASLATIPNKTSNAIGALSAVVGIDAPSYKIPSAVRFREDIFVNDTPTNLQEVAEGLGLRSMGLLQQQQGKHPKSAPPTTLGKYYTQYAFLGKIETSPRERNSESEDSEFRLCVRKPDLVRRDPLEELVMRKVEGAENIRSATREIDRQVKSASEAAQQQKKMQNKIDSEKKQPASYLQRSFMKTHANMTFSAFRAVEKAYQDRDQAEQLARKTCLVRQIKHQRKQGRNKVKRVKKNYANEACSKKHHARGPITEVFESRRKKLEDIQKSTAAMRESLAESQERARESYRFALDFRCQNASVGKALLSHDHNKKRREIKDIQVSKVSELRDTDHGKKQLLRDYKEQTAQIRQAETVADREELDLKLLKNEATRELKLREDLKRHQEKQMRKLKSQTPLAVFTVI